MNMTLGWKTIAGTIVLGIGQLLGVAITDCPILEWIPYMKWLSGIFNAFGMILTGIGLSSKIATATNSMVNSVAEGNRVVSKAMKEQKFIDRVIEKRIPYIVKRLGPDEEIIVKNCKPVGAPDIKKE
jgi:hypothetical protein